MQVWQALEMNLVQALSLIALLSAMWLMLGVALIILMSITDPALRKVMDRGSAMTYLVVGAFAWPVTIGVLIYISMRMKLTPYKMKSDDSNQTIAPPRRKPFTTKTKHTS